MSISIPKYQKLANLLEKDIVSNYKIGDQFHSIAKIMKDYSISLDTVKRAVGILEDKGLLTRIQGKGTYVNSAIKDINNKSMSIYLIADRGILDIKNVTYISQIFNGINEFLINKHIKMSIGTYNDIINNIDVLSSYDGIIFINPRGENTNIVNKISDKFSPCISVATRIKNNNMYNVDNNTQKAMHDMLNYLKTSGHKKIGFITSLSNINSYHEGIRKEEYFSYSEKIGLEVKPEWFVAVDAFHLKEDTISVLKSLSKTEDSPTAYIMSSYDYTKPHFITEMFNIKHPKVPRLSLIGFDKPVWYDFVDVKLSYAEQDYTRAGSHVINNLVKLILDNTLVKKVDLLNIELHKGDSVINI